MNAKGVKTLKTEVALQNIAKKGDIKVDVLTEEFNKLVESLPPSDDRDKVALMKLNTKYAKLPDNTNKYNIICVGYRNLTDFNAKRVKEALDLYKKNPEEALENGYVEVTDGKPVAIDRRKTFGKDNIKNANFGKPLGTAYNRNMLIMAREAGQTNYAVKTLSLRGKFATEPPVLYKPINVNLLGDIASGLKSAKSSKFELTGEDYDWKPTWLSLSEDNTFALADLLEEAGRHDSKDPGYYDRYIFTTGAFKFINQPKREGGNYNGMIDHFSVVEPVSVFVEGVLDEPETDKEYGIIGQTSLRKKWDPETKSETDEIRVMINVMGYFPI